MMFENPTRMPSMGDDDLRQELAQLRVVLHNLPNAIGDAIRDAIPAEIELAGVDQFCTTLQASLRTVASLGTLALNDDAQEFPDELTRELPLPSSLPAASSPQVRSRKTADVQLASELAEVAAFVASERHQLAVAGLRELGWRKDEAEKRIAEIVRGEPRYSAVKLDDPDPPTAVELLREALRRGRP